MPHAFGTAGDLPAAIVVLFVLVTQLGDLWLFFTVLSVLYWFGDRLPAVEGLPRERAAFVVALAVGALGLTTALKFLFAYPRPPGAGMAAGAGAVPPVLRPVYGALATAEGFGFPSGHAVGSTVVWGGLALVADWGTRTRRYAVTGVVVGLVGLSRVVIGVHYLTSVVAGVLAGAAYLAVAWRLGGPGRPGRAFSFALGAGVAAGLVGGFAREPMAVLGAAIGARLAWGALGGAVLAAAPTRRQGAVCVAVGLPVLGGLFAVVFGIESPVPATFVASGVVLAGVLALPLAVARVVDGGAGDPAAGNPAR